MPETEPMPMCPMAATCKGMMDKAPSRFMLWIPGLTFIVVGLLIIIWPALLAWLIAVACILIGIAMLMMAGFVRRVGVRFKNMRA